MNPLTRFFFPLLFCLLFIPHFYTKAQSRDADSLLTRALATDVLLPALIDSAIQFSPNLRRVTGIEDYATANLKIGKNAIYNALSFVSSYNYGTNISAINNAAVAPVTNNLTTAQSSFYNVGVNLQIPLTYVINRKHIIKSNQSQIDMAVAEKETIKLMIKQEIIRLYQDLKLAHRLMIISGKSKQTAQVNNTMAEKNFQNGQGSVDQVTEMFSIYNKSVIEYESYINQFQTNYMQLEAFSGVNLSSLIMQVK